MRKFKSHLLGVDQGSHVLFSDFEHDGEMWTGTGPREFSLKIPFSAAFDRPPLVHIGMAMWDIDVSANQRVDINAENITERDFDAVFRTWGDTRVARVRCDWIAMGELTDEDEWVLY